MRADQVHIMNAKNRIKIVKRTERNSCDLKAETAAAKSAEILPSAQKVARQVTSWVKEFQQRRVRESGQSFESLFQRA